MRRRWPPDSVPMRLGEHPVGQAEVGADPGRLGLGRVPAEPGELVLQRAVPADAPGRRRRPRPAAASSVFISASSVSRPRADSTRSRGGDVQVAGARVLRQVADRRRGGRPRRRTAAPSPASTLQRGGLAGAVAADQADPVAGLHAQGGLGQQDAGAGAQLQAGGGDHGDALPGRRDGARAEPGPIRRFVASHDPVYVVASSGFQRSGGGIEPSLCTTVNTAPNGSITEPIRPNGESCAGIGWEPPAATAAASAASASVTAK